MMPGALLLSAIDSVRTTRLRSSHPARLSHRTGYRPVGLAAVAVAVGTPVSRRPPHRSGRGRYTEHVPYLLEVPGVIAVTRLKAQDFEVSMGGELKSVPRGETLAHPAPAPVHDCDTEHVPYLLEVPGVIAVTRLKAQDFEVSMGGELKSVPRGETDVARHLRDRKPRRHEERGVGGGRRARPLATAASGSTPASSALEATSIAAWRTNGSLDTAIAACRSA